MCTAERSMEYADTSRRFSQVTGNNVNVLPGQLNNKSTSCVKEEILDDSGSKNTSLPNSTLSFLEESNDLFSEKSSIPTIKLNDHRIPMQSLPPLTSPAQRYFHQPSGYSEYDYQSDASPSPMTSSVPYFKSEYLETQDRFQTSWPEQSNFHETENTSSRCGNRGRTTYTDEQISALEKAFSFNPYPNCQARQLLAGIISVPESKVKIWFQNRRARAKKQKMSSGSWRRDGKVQRRSKDLLVEFEIEEKIQETNSNSLPESEISTSLNPNVVPNTPILLSDLTLGTGPSSGTINIPSCSLPSSLPSMVSSTCQNIPCEDAQNASNQNEKRPWPNYSQPYLPYPTCFPVIRQSHRGFSANYNQNSRSSAFNTRVSSWSNSNNSYIWRNWSTNQNHQCQSNFSTVYPTRSTQIPVEDKYGGLVSSSLLYAPPCPNTPPVSLTPPPVRRLVFPFKNLPLTVEQRPLSDVQLNRDFKLTSHSASDLDSSASERADFHLHGMDRSHQIARNQTQQKFEMGSVETLERQKHEILSGNNEMTIATPHEGGNEELNVSSSSDVSYITKNSSLQWPHHNVNISCLFDTKVQSEPSQDSKSLENNRHVNPRTNQRGWKLRSSVSSASVIG